MFIKTLFFKKKPRKLSICAVIAVRNELPYLRILLPMLAAQDIDVAILDNGSTDGSHELYADHKHHPIILVEHIPYREYFSLSEQLDAKQRVYDKIDHDWVIHHDADEILEHYQLDRTLRDAIQEADDAGYDVLNFDELVFLPNRNTKVCEDYYRESLRYYFFEPEKGRLNRAWKRSLKLDNTITGGHRVTGERTRVFPKNHILRHYIVLGYLHALDKYYNRKFDTKDRSLGWHANRLNFTRESLMIPTESPYLFELDSYNSKSFNKNNPTTKHFWEWAE